MPEINPQDGIRCDVHNGLVSADGDGDPLFHPVNSVGCGKAAVYLTDGSEPDIATKLVNANDPEDPERSKRVKLNRPAVPFLYMCGKHKDGWPHSPDAQLFAKSKAYKQRTAQIKALSAAAMATSPSAASFSPPPTPPPMPAMDPPPAPPTTPPKASGGGASPPSASAKGGK